MKVTGIEFDRARGERIKEAREALGLTQEELAPLVGVSKFAISKWESGYVLQRSNLQSLAGALKVSDEWLLRGGEERTVDGDLEVRLDEAEAGISRVDSRLSRRLDELKAQVDAQQALLEHLAASSRTPLPADLRLRLAGVPRQGSDPAKG